MDWKKKNCFVTTTSQAVIGNREKTTEILHDNLFQIIEQHHNQDVDNSAALTQSNLAMKRILLLSSCSLHTHANVLKPELPLVLPFHIVLISRKPCTWNDGVSKFEAWDFYTHCNSVGNPWDFTSMFSHFPAKRILPMTQWWCPQFTSLLWHGNIAGSFSTVRHKIDINACAHALLRTWALTSLGKLLQHSRSTVCDTYIFQFLGFLIENPKLFSKMSI